jgi:hypothetical protein
MSGEHDLNQSLDRAASAVLDAVCELRAAGARSLPHPHRRRLNSQIRSLERVQLQLFICRNDPWREDSWSQPKPRQMSML